MLTKNAIAVARDDLINPISERSRQHARNSTQTPNPSELRHHVKDRVGTREQRFVGLSVVLHDIHRVQILWVNAVTNEQLGSEFTLQRCKTNAIPGVPLKQELNEVVA